MTIEPVSTLEDVLAITTLYPNVSLAQRKDMSQQNLQTEFAGNREGKRTILLAKSGDLVPGTM